MALTQITKGVIKPNENYDTHNINSTGIVTAIGLDINGNADVSGSLSVGGVLTYEDVTSIDSVGIITARTGLVSPYADIDDFVSVGNNIHLGNAGVITATSFVGSGAALTGIDATAIKDSGGNVKVQAQASGAIHTGISTFDTIKVGTGVTIESNGQAEVAGITTFYKDVHIKSGTNRLYLGTNDRLSLIADPSHSYLRNAGTGSHFQIHSDNFSVRSHQGNGSITLIYSPVSDGYEGGGPRLYHNHGAGIILERFRTTKSGVNIVGTTTSTQLAITGVSTFTGAIDANGDLDVDGHTNLDNVSIAGVSTLTGDVTLGDDLIIANNKRIKLSGTNTEIFDDNNLRIDTNGSIIIRKKTGTELMAVLRPDAEVELYYNNVKKAYTESNGFYITDTGKAAMMRVLSSAGYDARIDMTADNAANEDNYRIEVNTDQKFRVYGKPGGNYTSFIELDQAGKVTLTRDVDVARHLDVDGHTELDNVRISGVVTATTYYGDGSNLSNITSTTINSNADNRVITGSGTANTLNAEQYLTWDGQIFKVNAATNDNPFQLDTGSSNGAHMRFFRNGTQLHFFGCGTGISLGDSEDLSMRSYDNILFSTGNSSTERLRIASDGQIQAGTSGPTYLKYTGSAVPTNNNNGTLLGSNNIGLIGQYSSLNMPFDHSTATTSGAWWMLGRSAGTTNEWGLYTRSGGQSNLLSVWKVIGNSNGTTNYQTFSTGSNSERLRITSGGILQQSATGGDNQFVSTRTGTTYNDGDYYFQLFAKNNSSTTMGALGIVRDTGNTNSRMTFYTADGGTNKERARIHRWGGLQLRNIQPPYGSSEPASRYIYSYHRSGTYNTFWAEIRFATPGSYCLDLRMGGYSNRHMHYTFQGYVYAGNDFASAAAIDSGNGPQRYYSNQGAYNTYGTIIRFGFSSMSATHPVVHMDLSFGAAGGDSLAEITNMLWS